MRILHLIKHRELYNGMVTAAVDLACAQAELGHEVAFCSRPGDFDGLLGSRDVRLMDLDRDVDAAGLRRCAIQIRGFAKEFRPDVLHAHMISMALIAYPLSRWMGIPLVTSIQNSFSRYAALMSVGDLVIAGSQAVARDMERRRVPARKLRPILNGTIGSVRQSIARDEPASASTTPPIGDLIRRPAIVTACGLHPRKGVADLIEAFSIAHRRFPEARLYVFGDGPNAQEYRTLAGDRFGSSIVFCGQTPNLSPFLRAADIFVLASLADPAPLVICEAREAGLAVIGTAVDGIPELLEFGEAGILVPPRQPAALADELVRLLADPDELARWKAKSQSAIARLGIGRVAMETVRVYDELVTRRDRRPGSRPAGHRSLADSPDRSGV